MTSLIEKSMATTEVMVRLECRLQYRQEGNTDRPDRYSFGSCEGLFWDSEATKIRFDDAQSSLSDHH